MTRTVIHVTICWLVFAFCSIGQAITLCPVDGCPLADDEFTVTSLTTTATWTHSAPLTNNSGGLGWATAGLVNGVSGGTMNFGFNQGVVQGLYDPHDFHVTELIDGIAQPSYGTRAFLGIMGSYGGHYSNGKTTINVPEAYLFIDGNYDGATVDSQVTTLNGFDLNGLGIHITRIRAWAGTFASIESTPGAFTTTAPITVEFWGATGEIPEPSTLALTLLGFALATLCQWYKLLLA